MPKITFIGAGSINFTQGLVADMIKTFNGEKWKLALVDIDESALEIAHKLCRKMLDYKNADIELSYSVDRCDVLPGSDYVVSTIAVGGRNAWEQDVSIPEKYGIFQPIGDSVMPGGISRAMRMIPAMLDITADIMRLCPDARFFNYANPMTMICRAVRKASGFPVTGLCHGLVNTEAFLADLAGLERNRVTSAAAGLNHLTFMYDFRYDGKDAWAIVREKMAEKRKNGSELWSKEYSFSCELFDIYGAFPAPGDRHVSEYYYDRFTGKGSFYGKTLGVDIYKLSLENGKKKFEAMKAIALGSDELTESYFDYFSGEHEQLMNIIHSIEHDSKKIFYANMPNNGAVPNLPRDAFLEMPGAATSRGMIPLQVLDFPDVLAGIISKHAAIVEVVVEAALHGDRNLFAEAVLLGGYISDRKAVSAMVDELLAIHSEYLPQFR